MPQTLAAVASSSDDSCDFTAPLPYQSAVDRALAESKAELERLARFQIVCTTYTYGETTKREVVASWLTLTEAKRHAEALNERYLEINPYRTSCDPYYNIQRHSYDAIERGKASLGDVVIGEVVEAPLSFSLTDTLVLIVYSRVGVVTELDALGRPRAALDHHGKRWVVQPKSYSTVSADQVDVEAALRRMVEREAELEFANHPAAFAPIARKILNDYLRHQAPVYPGPIPTPPDRLAALFGPVKFFAVHDPAAARPFSHFSPNPRFLEMDELVPTAIEVAEISAPRPDCYWGVKRVDGLLAFFGDSPDAINGRWGDQLAKEIAGGYAAIVPVAVRPSEAPSR